MSEQAYGWSERVSELASEESEGSKRCEQTNVASDKMACLKRVYVYLHLHVETERFIYPWWNTSPRSCVDLFQQPNPKAILPRINLTALSLIRATRLKS